MSPETKSNWEIGAPTASAHIWVTASSGSLPYVYGSLVQRDSSVLLQPECSPPTALAARIPQPYHMPATPTPRRRPIASEFNSLA